MAHKWKIQLFRLRIRLWYRIATLAEQRINHAYNYLVEQEAR